MNGIVQNISELEENLGFSAKELYSVSRALWKHYRNVEVPKNDSGELLQLYVPDNFLKAIQRKIANDLLSAEPISDYATAYREGSSTIENATPHIRKRVLLKLDIHHFFDNLLYTTIKEKVFPKEDYSEPIRVLLTLLCIYKEALPQGTPTSPVISNIVMRDFDNVVGAWCEERSISYTRYCDDMTFSGSFDPQEVIAFV